MRKSILTPLVYLGGVLAVLQILCNIGGGWFEYQNTAGTKVFRFDTPGGAYAFSLPRPIPGASTTSYSGDWFCVTDLALPGYSFHDLKVLHRIAALLVAIPAILWTTRIVFIRRKWNARVARRQCVRCGYDLIATPDRCPECGAHVIKAV